MKLSGNVEEDIALNRKKLYTQSGVFAISEERLRVLSRNLQVEACFLSDS